MFVAVALAPLAAFCTVGLLLAGSCGATQQPLQLKLETQKDYGIGAVEWWTCPGAPTFDCGSIIVPKDYFNASAGVAKVALSRYNATKAPRKGMVLWNPGGPGGSGKQMILTRGPNLQTLVGEDWDMVGFDPRGIGETQPATACFPPGGYYQFQLNTVLDAGFDVPLNLTDPALERSLLKQQEEADALYQARYALCGKAMGDELRYMGSSTVVRDLDFMTKTMEGEDALINFYGTSYGSILGQYLINMLPDRLGRVVIDGIVDTPTWANEPNYKWYGQWMSSTEPAYDLFVEGCSKAGPSGCALAGQVGQDPAEIRNDIEVFFDDLYKHPLPVPDVESPGIITSGRARNHLFRMLQQPMKWVQTASALHSAMQGNGSALLKESRGFPPNVTVRDLARQAVSCNDEAPLTPADAASNQMVVDALLNDLRTVSRFAGSIIITEPDSGCQYWPVTPPERFSGPWNHTLRNPVLIHSNTEDPVTPISSGRLVKKLLGDSAALAVREGPGHCSMSLPSLCTTAITRAYFANGTLPPDDGPICPVDVPAFPEANVTRIYSEDEMRVLKAIELIGETVARVRQGWPA